MGPLTTQAVGIYKRAYQRGRRKDEGRIITGGRVPEGSAFNKGYFFEPTLIKDVPRESRLLKEEVFVGTTCSPGKKP